MEFNDGCSRRSLRGCESRGCSLPCSLPCTRYCLRQFSFGCILNCLWLARYCTEGDENYNQPLKGILLFSLVFCGGEGLPLSQAPPLGLFLSGVDIFPFLAFFFTVCSNKWLNRDCLRLGASAQLPRVTVHAVAINVWNLSELPSAPGSTEGYGAAQIYHTR